MTGYRANYPPSWGWTDFHEAIYQDALGWTDFHGNPFSVDYSLSRWADDGGPA